MRVLFSTTAGAGHFGPMVPVARACSTAGHEVAVAAPDVFEDTVERSGFRHLAFASPAPERLGAVFERLPSMSREEGNGLVVTEVFGRLDAQAALPGLTAAMTEWRPDVVVREPAEFGSMVAAESAGIGQVEVGIFMGRITRQLRGLLHEPLAELSELAGLASGRGAELMEATPRLTSVPEVLDDAVDPDESPGRVRRFRDAADLGDGRLPSPWGEPDDPLVYVSFGSVAGTLPAFTGVYGDTLRALSDLPVRVLMTTGPGVDPATLGAVPGNARVEAWWRQTDVMPHAAAVVGHGGFGTTMTALVAGVPQVVTPLFSFDQFVHAERVAAVGAGVAVHGGPEAPAAVPAAVSQLLDDPRFRAGAQAVAAEMAALPDVATACLPVLEDLAG